MENVKEARLRHVACGLNMIQPGRESGYVTEETGGNGRRRDGCSGKIHLWKTAQKGFAVGDQRPHVLGHSAAWEYQMEPPATGDSGGVVGLV